MQFMSDDELLATPSGSVFVFDLECYANFFYVAFRSLYSGKIVAFERSPDADFNASKLSWMLWRFCIVGFNSANYDLPIIELAVKGASCQELKRASDYIIKGRHRAFDFEKEYGVKIGRYNHIDLIEVAPLKGSLKLYAGRLHCQKMQDLPYPEDSILTKAQAEVTRSYCCNDLSNTELLFNELASEIKLRVEMSEEYELELRSKSDAQLAEAVINSEIKKLTGIYPKKPKFNPNLKLTYNIPSFVFFNNPELRKILNIIKSLSFELDAKGSPEMPTELKRLKVNIGKSTYKLGMGGLHSTEKKIAHYASDEIILADNDVESFYPRTILNQNLYPAHLGEAFIQVYKSIVDTRINAKTQAKRTGDRKWKTIADSLKITINGSFGKLGSMFSTLYAPQLMLQVTITGQLVLLMLIEAIEAIGVEVISANTDGIISKYHKSRHDDVRKVIADWEKITAYKTEETRYKAVFSSDVNSYIALKESGDPDARFLDERLGAKTKKAFCERGSALNSVLSRNPDTLICIDAVLQYVVNGVSVESTIRNCKDIRRFVSVRNVEGGGEKNGNYLGKVVRWYYAKNEYGDISYVGSGNKVAKTDGAKPMMELPSEFPNDINYDWYIESAIKMLYNCGALRQPSSLSLFD